MSERRSQSSTGPQLFEHQEHLLERLPSGGFALEARGADAIRIRCAQGGWEVEGPEEFQGWRLSGGTAVSLGFKLLEADGETEAGRTMWLAGGGQDADLRYLLTSDGRLYRIRLCGPRDGRFELQGWEASGAYLTARPGARGWTISPDPAASGLREIRPLLILFAAEILDSEEPLAEVGKRFKT